MAKRNIVVKKNVQLDLFEKKEDKKFTNEQKEFIEYDGDKSVILSSCAGSGKTFSCIERLKTIISRGVDPNRIIFFSFTKDAVNELTERAIREGMMVKNAKNKDGVKINTIHSFCTHILMSAGKFKKIATFFDFIEWYKIKFKPNNYDSQENKTLYYNTISELYENSDYISSAISSFKLQSADGIKSKVPAYLSEYNRFMREKKSRDFSDMLIEVRDMFKEEKWLRMFRNKYDYIFIDEYQDTSTIQLQILLSLNAKYYYLVGDVNQGIYGYSGTNSSVIESMIKRRRETTQLSLSVNFRSDKNIVENSNKFSTLTAVPSSQNEGFVDTKVMLKIDELIEILKLPEEVAVLVRTNDVIKKLEIQLLKKKVPLRYFNFITEKDVSDFKGGVISEALKNKFKLVREFFNNNDAEIIQFIERYKNIDKFITTIHKSKGREFHTCVVVNSIAPEVLDLIPNINKLSKKQLASISFDPNDEDDLEPRNIHYVAVSRSKHKLYFMIFMVK